MPFTKIEFNGNTRHTVAGIPIAYRGIIEEYLKLNDLGLRVSCDDYDEAVEGKVVVTRARNYDIVTDDNGTVCGYEVNGDCYLSSSLTFSTMVEDVPSIDDALVIIVVHDDVEYLVGLDKDMKIAARYSRKVWSYDRMSVIER